jgi:hypothetical protein
MSQTEVQLEKVPGATIGNRDRIGRESPVNENFRGELNRLCFTSEVGQGPKNITITRALPKLPPSTTLSRS